MMYSFALAVCGSKSRKFLGQSVEDRAPAGLMPVARRLVEELLVRQGERGPVAVGPELDRHQRFALRRRSPRPREHELPVRDDLSKDPAHVVLLAARRAHDDAIAAADARIGLGAHRLTLRRTEPAS